MKLVVFLSDVEITFGKVRQWTDDFDALRDPGKTGGWD